jgi:hypothetical protein
MDLILSHGYGSDSLPWTRHGGNNVKKSELSISIMNKSMAEI